MHKKYTVLIIDDKGGQIRETHISRALIIFAACLACTLGAVIIAGTYDYLKLNKAVVGKKRLLLQISQHENQIHNQRQQLHAFAEDINELKEKLLALNSFEHKIRIMANLEHKGDQASIFAIGGSMPDDLDTDLTLQQDHDRLIRQMHDHLGQVEQASGVQKTSFEALLNALESKRNLLAATPSLRPTHGWVSSDFGYRLSPFTGQKEFHKGLDIATREGAPIIAPADGVITYTGEKWLMGNMIAIDHGYGVITRYGHLKKIIRKKDQKIKRGEVIAFVGNTGRSTGPHLHYEIRLNSVPVNPMHYILD